ncbi:pentatricopeptide repeat-containing protein At5g15010, mitochondrial isoform X1 [Apium graveolens]|uniref:pentatricopeptide repeat-containing protein At5g15010, mitochondrial isoform X1 n=1 Tax=Apium graveolens TaxID=4045 RepID=UPI003D7AF2B6
MATYTRASTLLTRLHISRYTLHQSHFSTLISPLNHAAGEVSDKNQINTNETQILNELSSLLPIRHKNNQIQSNVTVDTEVTVSSRSVDDFLLPEEKLRGVFLQKLRGKAAIERALDNVDVELSNELVAKVVNRGCLGGEAMVRFFEWAIKRDEIEKRIDVYNVIVKALGRRKYFDLMLEMLSEMRVRGVVLNYETLFIVMNSFVKGKQVARAIKMFLCLDEFGWECDTVALNVVLECLCKRSFLSSASLLVKKMKGKVEFNETTYNILMSGWSRCGNVGEFEKCLEAMVGDGLEPDSCTHSYLIECLGRAGRVNDAVEIFENLEKDGCVADVCVYNAMISTFMQIGDCDGCLRYYERMLSMKCDRNMDTYVRIIYGFLKARRVSDAIDMFDEMVVRGITPATGTVTSFIKLLSSYGPPHAMMMIYKKARKAGCSISLSAYKLLLTRLAKFGKCGMMLDIWDEIQENRYSSDVEVYQLIIIGLCNNGQLENAILVMEECLRKGFCPSRLVCSRLNNKLLTSNKVETAYKLFLKIKVARQSENARKHWRNKGWHF